VDRVWGDKEGVQVGVLFVMGCWTRWSLFGDGFSPVLVVVVRE